MIDAVTLVLIAAGAYVCGVVSVIAAAAWAQHVIKRRSGLAVDRNGHLVNKHLITQQERRHD